MKQSVYLSKSIHDKLCEYGELSDVVNRMLTDLQEAGYDVCNKPPCHGRDNTSRYNVSITNADYINTISAQKSNSKWYSLRRLIYWFVKNAIYEDLGWQPSELVKQDNQEGVHKTLREILQLFTKCIVKYNCKDDAIVECYEYVKELCNSYDNSIS